MILSISHSSMLSYNTILLLVVRRGIMTQTSFIGNNRQYSIITIIIPLQHQYPISNHSPFKFPLYNHFNSQSMHNWFSKPECTGNTDKLKQFYNKVLIDFLDKIYKENRYRTSGGIDQNKIGEFGEKIRKYLKQPKHLFLRCIEMKEGSGQLAQVIKNQITTERYTELKIEHEDEKDNYLPTIHHKTRSQSKIQGKNQHSRQDEQYEDDLAEYEDVAHHERKNEEKKKVEVEVKKEDNLVEYLVGKSEVKIEDGDDSNQSFENNLLTMSQCDKSLNSILLGTFNANSIKHKPKEEKTSIELDNVFVKWPQGETFYGSLSMEAMRMDKQTVKKELPFKGRKTSHQ